MEQFHVISLLGADVRLLDHHTNLSQATRDLNRKTLKLHFQHVLSWLLRGLVVASLFLLGRYVLDGAIGGALSWTSGFLVLYLLWYVSKGHLMIQDDRQAKLYWLQNDASNREFSSNDPIMATMPEQEPAESRPWYGSVAS